MQIKKCSLFVLFSLFLGQNLVAMDAPTEDDGEFKHLKTQGRSQTTSEAKSKKEKGKEKVPKDQASSNRRTQVKNEKEVIEGTKTLAQAASKACPGCTLS